MGKSRPPLAAFLLALLVHGLLFGVIVLSFGWTPKPEPVDTRSMEIVQATVVEREKLLAEQRRAEQAALARQQAEAQKREAAKQQAMAEQARQEAKKQQELEQKRRQEQARLKRLEAERKAKKEEARRKAEAERKRAEEEKRRAEAEKRRLEEERRRAEEARRKAEEERKKAAAAARRKAEEKRRQQELQARIEAEQNAAQVEAALNRFETQIQQRVGRYWTRPPSARDNLEVVLQVEMLPDGEVRNVKVVKTSGDRAFDRSAEAAVYKAAPLPVPPDRAAAAKLLPSFNFKFTSGS
ncbi:protein TolA [Nitrosococcus halophilus Nc 4]|uniref:Protein TolA n=1 Tax=Nitrosococcus halophilus (strain Nc4) TaxID=472759 RepID=D5C4W9_NITHN|nr:cell envelope integrity protein TolA [Nitrosococcus halophilus]ADE13392.1 protein TolA [Nitrosococcus halophilus Nc 4]